MKPEQKSDYPGIPGEQGSVLGAGCEIQERQDVRQKPAGFKHSGSPKGVGGWLLLFCIGVTFIAPLVGLAEILENPSDSSLIIIDVGLACFSVFTGIALWCLWPNALKIVKVYFIVTLIVACLGIVSLISTGTTTTGGQPSSQDPLVACVRAVVGVVVWWLYFKKSKRVKATFGANL